MSSAIRMELDFDVVREPWNKYELSDGSILKVKYVLLKVRKTIEPDGRTNYEVKGQNIIVVSNIPDHLRGRPSEESYSPRELEASIVEEDMRYNTLSEEWNEYVAEDGARIRIKMTVVKVSRTNRMNREGEPIYLVQSSTLAQIRPPRRERR